MKHLEDEDIGRLLDGTLSKQERHLFLAHLSQCKTCLTLYSETLKFMGDEEKNKPRLEFPVPRKITVTTLRHAICSILTIKKYGWAGWALAALLIILIMGHFLVTEFSRTKIKNAQIEYIENRIENTGSSAFFPSRGKIFTAVRIGIFVEDLSMLMKTNEKKELRLKTHRLLSREIKQLIEEKDSLFQELAHLDKKNFPAVVQHLRDVLEKRSLIEPFGLGRFLEQSIFAAYENKIPGMGEIEKYRQIAIKYELPPGVDKRLNQLKTITAAQEGRDLFTEMVEIFFK
jgi:hypothetical protein